MREGRERVRRECRVGGGCGSGGVQKSQEGQEGRGVGLKGREREVEWEDSDWGGGGKERGGGRKRGRNGRAGGQGAGQGAAQRAWQGARQGSGEVVGGGVGKQS